jgi:hypothetical protein
MAETREEVVKKASEDAAKKLDAMRPTPTQEENDKAKLGQNVDEKEDDGSGPDPHALAQATPRHQERHSEAKPAAAAYQTRQVKPTPTT